MNRTMFWSFFIANLAVFAVNLSFVTFERHKSDVRRVEIFEMFPLKLLIFLYVAIEVKCQTENARAANPRIGNFSFKTQSYFLNYQNSWYSKSETKDNDLFI